MEGQKQYLKKYWPRIFSKLIKVIKPHLQEALQISRRINKTTPDTSW